MPYPFQWGTPSFDAGEAFVMMMASFVALVEVCLLLCSLLWNASNYVENALFH